MHRPSIRFATIFIAAGVMALAIGSGAKAQSVRSVDPPAPERKLIAPAGSLVMDVTTGQPAVGSLPVVFVRSPDHGARDGGGRYLLVMNSGYGVQFSAATNPRQQSLALIDLEAQPAPAVVQNVYFPSPQSANVGAVFAPQADSDGTYALYVSGGFENRIWMFRFHPGGQVPITPPSPGPDTQVTAPFLSVSGFAAAAPTPRFNQNREAVYPTGLAISSDGDMLYVANNLADSLGIISNLRDARTLNRVALSDGQPGHPVYPYAVIARKGGDPSRAEKLYVSCWGRGTLAAVNPRHPEEPTAFIPVGRHPTAMTLNRPGTRIYVVNSDGDSVSVIDTAADKVVETISVRLAENALPGNSPESLALSADETTLYVANAHSNSVAVVALSLAARGNSAPTAPSRSEVHGFIPTGSYPSAIAVANGTLFIGNGKGTGFENSSLVANTSGRAPNRSNDRFPAGTGRENQGGQYGGSLVAGDISMLLEPDPRALADFTAQVMRNNGLVGAANTKLFAGASPFKHIIYVIKENRSYDQVFGDIARAGDGEPADGDPSLAIFGAGAAARRPGGPAQTITPNQHALALRFGLLDRFFVNSEASPDGHNWSTAAFSSDYVDKAYRWSYSNRGRSYDYQGENRMPDVWPRTDAPPPLPRPATAEDIANYMRRYIPYLNGARDISEPETLYLWDNAARAGLSYRVYGEFVSTISRAEVDAFNANRTRTYPDTTATALVFPVKRALEAHHSPTHRAFDLYTPDSMTTESYRAAKTSGGQMDPLISPENSDARFRGYSRVADWLADFRGHLAAQVSKKGDTLPNFSIVYLPNDHTNGLRPRMPTPQFYVAENDYAVGLLVQEVSASPYWKDTAIFIVEDDAQDGPDHVDAHRSPALVISAYNRPGALVHQYHNTVSLIRTMELLLGMPPMNQLDATAAPIDIFQEKPDLQRYKAVLPDVALDNLEVRSAAARDTETTRWIRRTLEQDLSHPDMADAHALDEIIWFSVRGGKSPMPTIARLPVFDAMRTVAAEDAAEELAFMRSLKSLLARQPVRARERTRDPD